RSLVGLGAALAASGDRQAAGSAFTHAAQAIDDLGRGGRAREATLAQAFMDVVQGHTEGAIGALKRLVERPEVPFGGWTIPIEPLFAPLRERADFQGILATLAQNAR